MTRAEILRNKIAAHELDTERLNQQYSKGVRPAWVSTEIAMNDIAIATARRELQALES